MISARKCNGLLVGVFLLMGTMPVLSWDNGDGTFSNPMIHADYPDSEIIRVEDDYYYLSSTFHFVPGNPIMHSKDLVNWKPVGHTIPNYNWDERYTLENGKNRYGAGSWAPTLRYHNGMFYSACFVWTEGNDKGRFMVTRSKCIEGSWETNLIDERLYDPGLLFDDGKVYVVHGQNEIYVTELDADLRKVVTPARLVYEGSSYFEGVHAYKINGMYYLFCTGGGKQQCLRSKNIYGPYEHKTVCVSEVNYPGTFLHQGGLIQTQTGEWWSILFQDRGKHGRIPFLLPVEWEDGWPMVQPVLTHKKPNVGADYMPMAENWRSDDFASPKLGLQWQWNHQPKDDKWSLSERKGWLRLRTAATVENLRLARNTLTQRILGPDSGAVVKMDVSNMQAGDRAGLGLLCTDSSSVSVIFEDGKKYLVLSREPAGGGGYGYEVLAKTELTDETLWLKAEVPYLWYAVNYSYSFDGKTFTKLGETLGIPYNFFSDWMAPRYCIFNYATKQTGGYVDLDSFEYILPARRDNLYSFGDVVNAQFADEIDDSGNCVFTWIEDGSPSIYVQNPGLFRIGTGSHGPFSWTAGVEGRAAGSWVKFNRIDFGSGNAAIQIRACGSGAVSFRLNGPEGPTIAGAKVDSEDWTTLTMPVKADVMGIHSVVVVFEPESQETVDLKMFVLERNTSAPD